MQYAAVKLLPLEPDDREQFILDNQEAFNYALYGRVQTTSSTGGFYCCYLLLVK